MKLTTFCILTCIANCIVSAFVIDTFTFLGDQDDFSDDVVFSLEGLTEINTYVDHLSLQSVNHTNEAINALVFTRDVKQLLDDLQHLVNQSIDDSLPVLTTALDHISNLIAILNNFVATGEGNVESSVASTTSEWCSQILPNIFMSAQQVAIINPSFAINSPPPGPTVCPTFDSDLHTYPIIS